MSGNEKGFRFRKPFIQSMQVSLFSDTPTQQTGTKKACSEENKCGRFGNRSCAFSHKVIIAAPHGEMGVKCVTIQVGIRNYPAQIERNAIVLIVTIPAFQCGTIIIIIRSSDQAAISSFT